MYGKANEYRGMEASKRWQVNVQQDGKRRSFYSSTPGRTGQREANAKADAWLDNGIENTSTRVAALYEVFHRRQKGRHDLKAIGAALCHAGKIISALLSGSGESTG